MSAPNLGGNVKFEIKNYWSGSVLFECEALNLKLAVEKAVEQKISLRGAVLRGADLSGAVLRGADLSGADLSGADLRDAVLSDADLRDAVLSDIKNDLFDVLLRAPQEAAGLLAALKAGKIDGSCYEGECACLVGTIANVRKCNYQEIPNLSPGAYRPAEKWFVNLKPGDTPENSSVAKITAEWIEEFQGLIAAARP